MILPAVTWLLPFAGIKRRTEILRRKLRSRPTLTNLPLLISFETIMERILACILVTPLVTLVASM